MVSVSCCMCEAAFDIFRDGQLIRYDAVAKAKGANMRRREFLGLGAVVTAAWPFAQNLAAAA